MIWLMTLLIVGVGAWFLKIPLLSYLCAAALVMSVMQYVDAIQKPLENMTLTNSAAAALTSKVPLYLSSLVAVVAGLMGWNLVVGLAVTVWIFFLFRWLRRLESLLIQLQRSSVGRLPQQDSVLDPVLAAVVDDPSSAVASTQALGLTAQLRQWLFHGNPVLKVAIVVLIVGVVLLLRFATEHWQLSLALKLSLVASISLTVTALGYALQSKNRSFALALEGLGLAVLFLTLFFAYYNAVIASFAWAALAFALIMALTLYLSLKQQAIELALMAMVIAYAAPFTLPVRNASAIELVGYYAVINLAVAILSTLRPWKTLNQIAFLITVIIGGGYAFQVGDQSQRSTLSLLIVLHSAIFIWLSFRFSQLLAKDDLSQFKLKPALDIALIFGAPIVAYIFIYLIYFEETTVQAMASLGFAILYAGLYQGAKRNQALPLISQSYFIDADFLGAHSAYFAARAVECAGLGARRAIAFQLCLVDQVIY